MKALFGIGLALFGALGAGCGASTDMPGANAAGANGGAGQAAGATGTAPGGAPSMMGAAGEHASGGASTSPDAGGASASSGGGAPTTSDGAGTGNGAAGAAPGTSPMKGVAFNLNVNGSTCDDLKSLDLSWYYAWSGTAPCANLEFVPQIWGSWKKLDWVPTPAKAVSKGAKYLLGFNEPDGTGQANMTVDEAIALWPDFDQPGVALGSPAVAGQEEWLPNFMTQVAAKKLRVDFIAIHWYGWNAGSCNDVSAFEGKIKWAEQWQRPIWVTELSCRLQTAAVTEKFFSDALVMLKKHPLVQRYSWFLSRSVGEFANATLLETSGKVTPLGAAYTAAPSKM